MNELHEWTQSILSNYFKGNIQKLHVYEAIQDMLQKSGGKLYKYYKFDQLGHALNSLKNQEIYCSKPSKFNDPFDCRIGININDLAKNQVAPLIQEVDGSLANELQALFRGKKMLEACSPIIQQFLKNKDLSKIIELCNEHQLTCGQAIQLLQKSPAALECVISTLMGAAQAQTGYGLNGISVEQFTEIINALDPNQLVSNQDGIDIIASIIKSCKITADVDEISLIKLIFQMYQPENSHTLDAVEEQYNRLDENLRELVDQNFFVGCLSEKPDNILMWSHYGESHTGFCIEYDFNRISLKDEQLLLFPVYYSEKRPPIPWKLANVITDDEKKRTGYDFIFALLTKDSVWSYEKEWRILRSIPNQSNLVSLPIVSGVYLGANCINENKNKILEITKSLHIPVHRMVVDRGVYKLHSLPL